MQCRRGYHGGIILKDVSLFIFLTPKNTVGKSVQICEFLHSLFIRVINLADKVR